MPVDRFRGSGTSPYLETPAPFRFLQSQACRLHCDASSRSQHPPWRASSSCLYRRKFRLIYSTSLLTLTADGGAITRFLLGVS